MGVTLLLKRFTELARTFHKPVRRVRTLNCRAPVYSDDRLADRAVTLDCVAFSEFRNELLNAQRPQSRSFQPRAIALKQVAGNRFQPLIRVIRRPRRTTDNVAALPIIGEHLFYP